mgnify:CR=1 FL=1
MDMVLIHMGADNKGMVSFCELQCQLPADLIGFFRRNFAGLKCLTEMVGDHIIRTLISAGQICILSFGQKKLCISKPGLWMQKLTTREPDRDMAEVAIAAVEAVFDWRAFLDEYYADLEGEEARNEAVKASEQALADEAAARGYNKIKEQVELNATSADSETRKIKPSEQTEAVAKAAAQVSSDEGIKIEEPEIPSEVSSVNVSDAGINESEDGIELEDDIESEDGEQIEDDTQTEDSLPDEDVQDTEEDELGGIEIEEPQESGEEIENADDVPIFKKRDSE